MLFFKARTISFALLAVLAAGPRCFPEEIKLSKTDRRWLERDVASIITEEEVQIFKELASKEERKLFKELFWIRRDPNLMTPQNEYREAFEERIELANGYFKQRGRKGSTTDRGRVFLLLGAPGETFLNTQGGPEEVTPRLQPQSESAAGPSSGSGGRAVNVGDIVSASLLRQRTQTLTWVYEPNPRLGISTRMQLLFRARSGQRVLLMRSDEIDQMLASAKDSYIVNRDIAYTRDAKGRLLTLPSKLDPGSPAKQILRKMLEENSERKDIAFTTEMSFFSSTEGTYAPIRFEVDSELLHWIGETAEVTLFGAIETADGRILNHFEERAQFVRQEGGGAYFEMPFQLQPGSYTFNLGILDDKSKKAGTRKSPVFVPGFDQKNLVMSSVLLYSERRESPNPSRGPGRAFQFGRFQFKPKGSNFFTTQENLGILFFVYGYGLNELGQPSLTGDYLFYQENEHLHQIVGQPLQADPSQAMASLEVPLTQLEPGKYRVEIKVTDSITDESVTDRIEFVAGTEPYGHGDYSELVDLYRTGSFAEATRGLSSVPKELLERAARSYGRRPLSDNELEVAALVHTETAVANRTDELFHLSVARDYLERIGDAQARQEWKRRWFLVVALHLQNSTKSWGLLPVLEDALELFPDNADIRLAVGSVYETLGWIGVEEMLEDAEGLYRSILDADPGHREAHQRLGRVLQLAGRREEALPELEWGLEGTGEPMLDLVAHVLAGDIYDQRGDLPKAIESFRSALLIDPRCQAAAVALSHALHRVGDSAGSREVLSDFLQDSEIPSEDGDLWWRYLLGDAERLESVLWEMREAAFQ